MNGDDERALTRIRAAGARLEVLSLTIADLSRRRALDVATLVDERGLSQTALADRLELSRARVYQLVAEGRRLRAGEVSETNETTEENDAAR